MRRRREETSLRVSQARRAARRRRRLELLAGLVAVAAGVSAVSAWLVLDDDDGPRPGLRAEVVTSATGILDVVPGPASYRLVYRVEAYDEGGGTTVSTEDISVRRPFDGRVVIREGEPPGAAVRFEGRATFGRYANIEAGASQVAGASPTVALGDIRLDASLVDLVADGTFLVRERRRALGRECQVYRTGAPLQSVRVTLPTESDYVDTCVDGTGLVLEEVTVKAGRAVQRLTATEVAGDVVFDPGTFAVEGTPVGLDQGGGSLTPIDTANAPAPAYWTLGAPPEGFEYRGRFELQTGGQAAAGSATAAPVTSWLDVYVRGIDFVVVQQGPSAAEPDSADATTARDVDLGPLGTGRLVLGAMGTTVVAHPAAEGFVQVTGTLRSTALQDITRALQPA